MSSIQIKHTPGDQLATFSDFATIIASVPPVIVPIVELSKSRQDLQGFALDLWSFCHEYETVCHLYGILALILWGIL